MQKTRLTTLIGSVMASAVVLAAEPTIVVEDARMTNPAIETGPPEEIEEGIASDGGEWLRNVNGVDGSRMGGHGIDPIIRGQKNNQLNILLDGAYLYGACPNRMDPPTSYAAVETYETVSVIRGSQTVLYGGGGSGGTVLFERTTPRFLGDEHFRGSASLGYVSNSDTVQAGLDLAGGGTQGFIRGIANYTDAGNYTDGSGDEVRSAYTAEDASLILGYTPSDGTRLELSYEAVRNDDVLYAGAGMDGIYADSDTVRLRYKQAAELGVFSNIRADLYSTDIDHLMNNYSLRPLTAPVKAETTSTSNTAGGRLLGDIRTRGGTTWTFGVDYQNNDRDANRYFGMPPGSGNDPNTLQSLMWPGVTISQSGLLAEVAVPVNPRDRFKAGLRYDYVDNAAASTKQAAMGVTPQNLYDTYYAGANPDHSDDNNLGGFLTYEYGMNDNAVLYSTLSRAVRAADATELYLAANSPQPMMQWIGNPNLAPEAHYQLDVGVNWEQRKWNASASVYYDYVDDFILQDRAHGQEGILQTNSATIYRNVTARLYGFEAQGNYRISQHWSSQVTMSYVNATNLTDDRAIGQTPPFDATLSLDYTVARLMLGGMVHGQATQTRVEDDPTQNSGVDPGVTPGWVILNLYGSYELGKDVTLKAGVNNVFDLNYAYSVNRANVDPFNPTAIQVNEPGREFWLRLFARF
ncbi:MAG: TonB-dependent copper receptor [Proteobacteria bacterium]|jgi:iron complex outermembrane receptor protein|nr:TonB-dependent copper receptor [Pseudomonadota bacterium]